MSLRGMVAAFNLAPYLAAHGGKPLSNGEWVLDCPRCGKRKLSVHAHKKIWHCWVCESYQSGEGSGGLISLLALLEGGSRQEAIAKLVEAVGHIHVPIDELDAEHLAPAAVEAAFPRCPIAPPEGWAPIEDYWSVRYLRQRGISEADVRDYGLLYCASGRYAGRLIFPVWEEGVLVYYQARATWEASERPGQLYVKALNPPAGLGVAGKADVVFNLDRAAKAPRTVITEGPIDAIHVGSSAVAVFGKKLSMTQILKMRLAGVEAVDLCWDGPTGSEPAGAWPDMLEVAPLLSGVFRDVRLVFLPRGDPGDYDARELSRFIAQAKPAASLSKLARV